VEGIEDGVAIVFCHEDAKKTGTRFASLFFIGYK
jgi:hypothetical protein